MSQPNKDNRPEAVLDRVLEKTGVMSQPKSNEEIINELANEIHSTFASAYAIKESVSHEWLKNIISKALAQKDAEVAKAVKESFNHFSWCRECGEGPFCREALSIAEKYGLDYAPKE